MTGAGGTVCGAKLPSSTLTEVVDQLTLRSYFGAL